MKYVCVFCFFILPFFPMACGSPTAQQENVPPKSANSLSDSTSHDLPANRSVKEAQHFAPGQVLVKFKKGTKRQIIDEIQQELGLEIVRIVSRPDLYLMKIKSNVSVPDMIRLLQNSGAVEYAEPNFRRTSQ